MNFLEKLKPLGLLLLRCGLGVIFVFYGYPLLFHPPQKTIEFFASIGFPAYLVYVTGAAEFFSGCLMILGLFTRIAGLVLTAVMSVAIWKVHLGKGVLAVNEYALPLALAVAAFALATTGAGTISLDKLIFREKR